MMNLFKITIAFSYVFFSSDSFVGVNKDLVEQYNEQFQKVESEALFDLEKLMAEAKAEYKEYKKHGKSTVHLYIKYIKKGKVLEKEIDDRFYTLLNRFKNDLLNHNSSMDFASFYEDHYQKTKQNYIRAIYRLK